MKKKSTFAPLTHDETLSARFKLSTYIFAASAVTLLSGIVAALCVLFSYDAELNYYTKGPLVCLLYVLFALACVYAVVTGFSVSRRGSDDKIFDFHMTERRSFASLLPMLASLGCVFARYYWRRQVLGNAFTTFDKIILFFSLLSAAYFFLSGIFPNIGNAVKLILGFAAMLAFGMYTVEAYFEYFLEMNSPAKLLLQFGAVLCMVYLAYELRFSVGAPRPRIYYIFSVLAADICLVSSVTYIMLFVNGRMTNMIYLSENILLVTMFVCITEKSTHLVNRGEVACDGILAFEEGEEGEEGEISIADENEERDTCANETDTEDDNKEDNA